MSQISKIKMKQKDIVEMEKCLKSSDDLKILLGFSALRNLIRQKVR